MHRHVSTLRKLLGEGKFKKVINFVVYMEAIHIKGKTVTLNAMILHCMQNHCALFSNHSAPSALLGKIEHWDNCHD